MNLTLNFFQKLKLKRFSILAACALAMVACSTQDTVNQNAAPVVPAATATVAAPPVPAPNIALPYDEAVAFAANKVMGNAKLPADQKFSLVIDPLIDGVTGAQTAATAAMEKRLIELIKSSMPQVEIKAFSAANVATLPLILVGTFTPVNLQGKPEEARDAYRICFSLADLKTGKIISKGLAFAKPDGIDASPLAFFNDSPVWVNDKVIEGYIKTCQGSKAGDAIQPAYVNTIVAATAIDEAQRAYHAKKYKEALALYSATLKIPSGDQARVYMGIYLSSLKLNRRESAMQAFGKLVHLGLDNKRLAVKFNFKPGSASFAADAPIHDRWLKEIAKQSAQQASCIEVTGHSSRGGSETMNEQVSLLRAEFVRQRMESEIKALKQKLTSLGVGSKKPMIGTGKDDQSDALDRRIEFNPTAC
jgi:outer membrane protein OmpA-like peptidoglycan-associated protein